MKKWAWCLVVVALFCGVSNAQQSSGFSSSRDRIVFIDLERTFNEFYKTKLAKSKIEVQQKDLELERQLMVDEMTAIDEEVNELKKEARDTTLSEEIRNSKRILFEERLLDLREKQKEIDEFVERRREQLQQQVSRMSQKIMDEIREAVINYSKEKGFMAVMDSSTRRAAVGVFLYTHPDVQITDDVLNVLNSKRPENIDSSSLFEDEESSETEQQ